MMKPEPDLTACNTWQKQTWFTCTGWIWRVLALSAGLENDTRVGHALMITTMYE